jgi:hypothetical protein
VDSTLTAVSSPGCTQHVHPCAATKTASPLTFVVPSLVATPPEQVKYRLIRSAPSRPADVAVAQNDLPPSCATGPGPVAHPASRSMTSPSPSVTVMIRPAAVMLIRPPTEMGVRWAKQARHTLQMDRIRMRGEEHAVSSGSACKAFRTRRRDGLTTTTVAAVAAGRCWSCLSARADSLHGHV